MLGGKTSCGKRKPPLGARLAPGYARNKGLSAQWLLNEGGGGVILDSSGHGNTGTLNGGVTWGQGEFGACLGFGASGSYVATPLAPRFGDFTVVLRFLDLGSPSFCRILDNDYVLGFWLGQSGTAGQWGGGVMQPSGAFGQYVSFSPGEWHQLALVRQGTTATVYGDGIASSSSSTVLDNLLPGEALRIARNGTTSPGGDGFVGLLDVLRIYSRALTPAEIQSLYLYPFAGMAQRRAVAFAPPAPTASPWQPFSIRSPPGPADPAPTWTLRTKPLAFLYPGFPPQGTTWQPFAIRQAPGLPEPDGWQQIRRATGALFPAPPPPVPWQPYTIRQMPGPPDEPIPPSRRWLNAALLPDTCLTPLVQSAQAGFASSASTRTLAFASNVTAGNLLLVAVKTNNANTDTVTITDSQGNSYSQVGGYVTNGINRISLWYTNAVASGANTVSSAPSTAMSQGIGVLEFSGIAASGPLDHNVTNTSGGATAWTTGLIPVNPANVAELVVGVFGQAGGNNTDFLTAANGFTLQCDLHTVAAQNFDVVYAVGQSNAVAVSGTFNASRAYAAIGASFKCAVPQGPVSPWQPFAIRQMQGMPDPEGWQQVRQIAGALFPGFTQPPASPWQPWAIRQMQALPEPEPWYQTRYVAGALFPGFTGPTVSPWQPFAIKVRPGPPEPQPGWTLAPKPLGFLWPGRGRRSPKKPFIPRVPDEDRRTARFTEQVSILLNSLLAQGYIQLVSQDPITYQILGGALSGPRAPASLDDAEAGAVAGCAWVNTLTNQVYICASATIGAAVWRGPI